MPSKATPCTRRVHATHHVLGSDLTVFGTAYMEPVEAVLLVFSFYGLVAVSYVKVRARAARFKASAQ